MLLTVNFFATRCDDVRSTSPTVISAAASLDATAAVHKPFLQQEHGVFSFVSSVVLIVWNTHLSFRKKGMNYPLGINQHEANEVLQCYN